MKKSIKLMLAGSVFFAGASLACSEQEADEKAKAFNVELKSLQQTDPALATQLSEDYKVQLETVKATGDNPASHCAMYDRLLAAVESSKLEEEPELGDAQASVDPQ